MFTVAKLLLALAQLLSLGLNYARERDLMNAGEEQAIAVLLKTQADIIDKADKARAAAHAANSAVPTSSILPDDGFRRD